MPVFSTLNTLYGLLEQIYEELSTKNVYWTIAKIIWILMRSKDNNDLVFPKNNIIRANS